MKKIIFSLLAGITIFISASVVSANVGDTYGFSANGMSMGNAMTAHVDDWSSVFYNMAGLGRTCEMKKQDESINQISLSYFRTFSAIDLNISRYNSEGEALSTPATKNLDFGMTVIGMALDLNMVFKIPEFISSARFGLGTTLSDDLTVVKLNDIEPQSHDFLSYGRETQETKVLLGVGLGFFDDTFGIGLGTNASFAGDGKALVQDVGVENAPQTADGQSVIDVKMKPTLLFGLYFSPGKIFSSAKGVEFGFNYRQKATMTTDFSTTAILNTGNIATKLLMSISGFWQPDTYTFGTAVNIGEKAMVSFDLECQEWSEYEFSTANRIVNGDILPKLDDIFIPKLGLKYKISDPGALLLGYYYQPTYIPDNGVKGEANWMDNNKHVVSAGIKWRLAPHLTHKPVDLSIGYQLQYLEDRDVNKTDPTNTLNPNYSYGGTFHSIMVGVQHYF